MLLTDRVALITGAGKGLGFATAQAFAAEGAKVMINDLAESLAQAAAERLGSGHAGVGGDVGNEEAVRRMVQATLDRYGRIDILVNNAGIADSFTPTVDQKLDHWNRLISTHLTGTYLVSKTVAPHMIAQRSGVILNLSSVAGVVGLSMRPGYTAAKAGISMMTRALAGEWGPHNIRVNAVAPGFIKTSMTGTLIEAGRLDYERICRGTPMGRMGTPEEIADAMVFLASDRARFITGVTLQVDGGYCSFGAPNDAFTGDIPPHNE